MDKAVPQLCERDVCTGCGSCAQSCTHNAIDMQYNAEGYYNPVVDYEKCIGCKICEKRCPVINPIRIENAASQAFAACVKDDETRRKSSSGGAFSAIAIPILKNGGVVWGAGYSDDMTPIYKCIDKTDELDSIRGSKYVQCKIGETYKKIKEQLKEGKQVLFCGTPCHVAGLYAFLNNRLTEKLLTVDFICHGVPSPKLFGNYINWLEDKYDDKAIDFNFRESRFGTNYNIGTSITFKKKGKKFLYLENNSYTLGFCKDLTIHKSCDFCKFRGTKRVSDFTIGDFHGTKREYCVTEQYKGISSIIANSKKATDVIDTLDMQMKQVPLERIIKSNPSYTKQTNKRKVINLVTIVELPYTDIQKQYFHPSLKDKIKTVTMVLFGGKITYIIKNIL